MAEQKRYSQKELMAMALAKARRGPTSAQWVAQQYPQTPMQRRMASVTIQNNVQEHKRLQRDVFKNKPNPPKANRAGKATKRKRFLVL